MKLQQLIEGQRIFSPADYAFRWTDDWYEWDATAAHAQARQERDAMVRELQTAGRAVKKFTLSNQRITRGGIGSGHPEIDLMVTGYGVNFE